jgi:hypothetical protein
VDVEASPQALLLRCVRDAIPYRAAVREGEIIEFSRRINMLTRRAFTGLLASNIAGTAAAASSPTDLSPRIGDAGVAAPASRRPEADELRRFAETTHPNGPAASLDSKWRERAAAFVAASDELTEAQYPVEAMRLLSWFKDGHTSVYVPELHSAPWSLRLPLGRDIFTDGMFVTSVKEEAAPLLGARITRIAGTPINELIRRFSDVWPSASAAWVHRWSILLVSSPGFLHAFGALDGPPDAPVSIEGEVVDGSTVNALVRPRTDGAKDRRPLQRRLSELEKYSATQSYGLQTDPSENGRNFVRRVDNGHIVYISLDRMGPDDFGKPFQAFDQEVTDALRSQNGKRLIVDLRRNGGGDNMLCEPMRKRIGRSRFNRPGGLYVLIAPHTFSAAQNLANRMERETFALFVGEPTGSSPNHCGDAKQFKGRVTALPAQVSTVRWMDSSPADKRRAIMPDVLVPSTFADFLGGRDPVLEAAYSHRDNRRFDDATISAPWERESQSSEWKPFWV